MNLQEKIQEEKNRAKAEIDRLTNENKVDKELIPELKQRYIMDPRF